MRIAFLALASIMSIVKSQGLLEPNVPVDPIILPQRFIMDLSPDTLNVIYQEMLTDFEANGEDESYLTKTITQGSLTATIKIDEKKQLNVSVILKEQYEGLVFQTQIFTSVFRYNEQLAVLIATSCDLKPVEIKLPQVQTQCEKETTLASEIIKYALSNSLENSSDTENIDFITCIKTKIVDLITSTGQNCFVVVLDQGKVKYSELKQKMIKDQIDAMVAKGYTCDAQGRCTIDKGSKSSETSTIVESKTYTKQA